MISTWIISHAGTSIRNAIWAKCWLIVNSIIIETSISTHRGWVKPCMRQQIRHSLVQIMACHLSGKRPSSKKMMTYWQKNFREILTEIQLFPIMWYWNARPVSENVITTAKDTYTLSLGSPRLAVSPRTYKPQNDRSFQPTSRRAGVWYCDGSPADCRWTGTDRIPPLVDRLYVMENSEGYTFSPGYQWPL